MVGTYVNTLEMSTLPLLTSVCILPERHNIDVTQSNPFNNFYLILVWFGANSGNSSNILSSKQYCVSNNIELIVNACFSQIKC